MTMKNSKTNDQITNLQDQLLIKFWKFVNICDRMSFL